MGPRNRDLPVCSIVPQTTTLPRALVLHLYKVLDCYHSSAICDEFQEPGVAIVRISNETKASSNYNIKHGRTEHASI
jgi:aryl-phospho-beta-D-glucosidase BglC (GH1 family)